eukprot:TRINITY_DN10644_c0_g1_i1.p1 TRINITY_DN10644_c0_g1~~TRINITY_DN10644_c0_g1_i1.p1  ORF type:complete len:869 (-),score=140.19 TRINITY_DN10644_c0_g1_i1:161-2767(-)
MDVRASAPAWNPLQGIKPNWSPVPSGASLPAVQVISQPTPPTSHRVALRAPPDQHVAGYTPPVPAQATQRAASPVRIVSRGVVAPEVTRGRGVTRAVSRERVPQQCLQRAVSPVRMASPVRGRSVSPVRVTARSVSPVRVGSPVREYTFRSPSPLRNQVPLGASQGLPVALQDPVLRAASELASGVLARCSIPLMPNAQLASFQELRYLEGAPLWAPGQMPAAPYRAVVPEAAPNGTPQLCGGGAVHLPAPNQDVSMLPVGPPASAHTPSSAQQALRAPSPSNSERSSKASSTDREEVGTAVPAQSSIGLPSALPLAAGSSHSLASQSPIGQSAAAASPPWNQSISSIGSQSLVSRQGADSAEGLCGLLPAESSKTLPPQAVSAQSLSSQRSLPDAFGVTQPLPGYTVPASSQELPSQQSSFEEAPFAVQGGTPIQAAASIPGSTHINAPVSPHGGAPIEAPVPMQGGTPVNAPLSVQGGTPIHAPVSMQGGTPVNAALSVQGGTPIHAPMSIQGATPVNAPLSIQGGSPIRPPMPGQGDTPIQARQSASLNSLPQAASSAFSDISPHPAVPSLPSEREVQSAKPKVFTSADFAKMNSADLERLFSEMPELLDPGVAQAAAEPSHAVVEVPMSTGSPRPMLALPPASSADTAAETEGIPRGVPSVHSIPSAALAPAGTSQRSIAAGTPPITRGSTPAGSMIAPSSSRSPAADPRATHSPALPSRLVSDGSRSLLPSTSALQQVPSQMPSRDSTGQAASSPSPAAGAEEIPRPPDIDQAVWNELPVDVRRELAAQIMDSVSRPPPGVDSAVWETLPIDMRQELLREAQAARPKAAAKNRPAPSSSTWQAANAKATAKAKASNRRGFFGW